MESINEQKGTKNRRKGGGLKSSERDPSATPIHVFSKLVELESGRKASEAIEKGGVQRIEEQLLPKISLSKEQKAYFDCGFRAELTDENIANRLQLSLSRVQILKGEVFQALLKAQKDLRKEERTKGTQGKNAEPFRWTHVHSIDFQAMEDWVHGEPDTPFAQQVRKKMACAPSPFDELTRNEREEEEENRMKKIRATLAHLVKHAKFTELEKQCYELLYVTKVSDKEVLKNLGISLWRLAFLKRTIQEKLIRANKRLEKRKVSRKRIHGYGLTKREREIWKLRFIDRFTLEEIGTRLGVSKVAVFKALKQIQKKRVPRDKG